MTRLSPLHHSLLVLLLTSWMSFSSAIFQPSCGGSSRSSSLSKHSLFGVLLPPNNEALFVRGGEVLTPETLEDVEAIVMKAGSENKLVIIDFYAEWCGPCKIIAPLFQELSDTIPGVVFVKVDVDENPDTAAKYNVSAMPTFVAIKGGEVVDRLMGASPARLQEIIDEYK